MLDISKLLKTINDIIFENLTLQLLKLCFFTKKNFNNLRQL